jgi:hypothetical protein
MIPIIGVMIGFYIFTRMLDLLAKVEDLQRPTTKLFAVLTMIVTFLGTAGLVITSFTTSMNLPY